MKSLLKFKHWPLVTYIVALIGIYHSWFLSFNVRTDGDWTYYFKNTLTTLRANYFTTWMSDYSFGRVLLDGGQAPSYAAYGLLAKYFGLEYAFSERIVHLWPIVLFTPITAYILSLYLFKNRWAALVSAIVYSSNTYIIILETGGLTLAGAYALVPLVFYFLIRAVRELSPGKAVLAGLALSACSAYEPREAYVCIGILAAFCTYEVLYGFFALKAGIRKTLVKIAFCTSPFIIFLLLNFYWILGLSQVKNALGGGILARDLFGSNFFNIGSSLTLSHPYWNFAKPIAFIVNSPPLYFWLIPLVAFSGMYLNRKNRDVFFFSLVAPLGIFLTKQADAPFTGIYSWLFHNVPGFNAFREASKFYLLTAISYSVLFGSFVAYITTHKLPRIRYIPKLNLRIIGVVAVSLLFLPNLVPIVTGSIETTFAKRTIPAQYENFANLINRQDDYFRIMWVPKISRWSVQSANHSQVDSIALESGSWAQFIDQDQDTSTSAQYLTAPLQQNFSNIIMDDSSVKYVVIPIRDTANDDDFFYDYGHDRQAFIDALNKISYLHRLNLPTGDLAVYENDNYSPFASAGKGYFWTPQSNNLDDILGFKDSSDLKGLPVHFSMSNQDNASASIIAPFSQPNASKLLSEEYKINDKNKNFLYVDKNARTLSYKLNDNAIIFTQSRNGTLYLNNSAADTGNTPTVFTVPFDKTREYYIERSNNLLSINNNSLDNRTIGSSETPTNLVYADKTNLIPNASLENGLWQKQVEDCNNFGANPDISMKLDTNEHSLGMKSLMLKGMSHTACTGPDPLKVTSGNKYLLSFDYKIIEGHEAGYTLQFNDPKKTTVSKDLLANTNSWRNYRQSIVVPDGATSVRLVVKGIPDDHNKSFPTNYYDNFRLSQLNTVQSNISQTTPEYAKIPLQGADQKVEYKDTAYNFNNTVDNGSLEKGLWQQHVGDCDAYDSNPRINMSLDKKVKFDGQQSLKLTASRHIACTEPPAIKVKDGSTYLLNFEYRSDGKTAGYNISFNDPSKTSTNEHLDITSGGWNSFSKRITIPPDATAMHLTLYGYPGATNNTVSTNYDAIKFIEVPDVQNVYFITSIKDQRVYSPQSISSEAVSQTRRNVTVDKVKGPFYLNLSESYHPQWQLMLRNSKTDSLRHMLPNASSDAVKGRDHYQLDNFLNGWYIDPAQLCKNMPEGCTKNADGSYNLQLVAEFTPQRWFYVGSVISGVTLVAAIGYLGFTFYRKRRATTDKPLKTDRSSYRVKH